MRVGKTKITKAGLLHWMQVLSPYYGHEVPVAPDFNACIIALRKKEPIDAGGEGQAANVLKGVCKQRYETLKQTALAVLINDAWLIEEAARDGIKADEPVLAREKRELTALLASRPGGIQGYLKRAGKTAADLDFETRVSQLSGKIYQFAERATPVVNQALIASYYARHKRDFAIPETRDLYILHTRSRAAALRAKREIRSGRSFASLVESLHVPQPFSAKEGLTIGLTRKGYSEPSLINAIFSARPGVLTGPFRLGLNPAYEAFGYYVFQVIRKTPPHQMPFAKSAAIIKAQAPEQLHKKTLAAFVAAYKARWKARTECAPGYLVEACRRYKRTKGSQSGDPYVL